MNHETEEMLTALLDGQLSAEQASELRARLEHDSGLRELWEQLQAQRQLLRGLPRQKAPQDFLSKVAVALQEQAVEVTPALGELDDRSPRGGWRAVFALAAALAALLLVGVFFWPRDVAQNSDRVASIEGGDRARQLEVEELKRQERGEWEESAPVQSAPQGALPKAVELAGGRAESAGAAAEPAADMKAMAAEQPLEEKAEQLQAQAATDEGMPGFEAKREARRDLPTEDSEKSKLAGNFGMAPGAPGVNSGEPPLPAASDAPPEVASGLDAAAEVVGPIEVWVVDKAAADRAAGAGKQVAASQVEVFFASVAESELPSWLSELQSSAVVTRLDSDESRELFTQLNQQRQTPAKRFSDKPMGRAAADLDGPAGQQGAGQGSAAPNRIAEPAAQVDYLGLQQAEPLDALVTRSQMRQQSVQESGGERQRSGAVGGGGGGGATGAADNLKDPANATLENYLSGLRARSVDSQQLPEARSGGGGRNVLIIIRER